MGSIRPTSILTILSRSATHESWKCAKRGEDYFPAKPRTFYRKGISKASVKIQKRIDNDSEDFDY